MSALSKHAKKALAHYKDSEIAALVANKRLLDFKEALSKRNILSMDSPGTYSWIIHQTNKNLATLGAIPSFDELFANEALADLIDRMPKKELEQNASYTH
tara:strand:- start:163 stop:462 length:300 start_codon:yes stop_codon:yes gene_type:complete